MVLEGVSKFSIISAIITSVAFLFHLIGFATANWIKVNDNNYYGLWYICVRIVQRGFFLDSCGPYEQLSDWLRAVQAFETLAFIALVATLVLIVLKWFVMKDQRILLTIKLILQIGTVGAIILGVIIFGAESVSSDYGYSFVMCILAAIICLVAAIFTFLEMRELST